MFIVIGVIGALLLLFGLVFGDALDGIVPESDWLSMSAIATFLVAFGFGAYLVDSRTSLPTVAAAACGTAAGLGLGYVALRWSRSLSTMATDATPSAADLIGCHGRIITAVLPQSTGEALVRLGGQPVKLTAVAAADQEKPLESGTDVVVVNVLSPTRVEVQTAEAFWGSSK